MAPSALNTLAPASQRFLIRPNSSLSWQGNKLFFLLILAVSFAIAAAFSWMGLWLVLPFAGLEMLVLGLALYHCATRASTWELISIEAEQVKVVVGRRQIEKQCAFDRCWTQVVLEPAACKGHPSRLLLRARGWEVEVGAQLVEEERQQLAGALKEAVDKAG